MRKDTTLEVSSAANKEGHMTQKHSMSARGLAVGYGDRTVIEGLDVDFPRGQITTIIGPNGCGKSTLLRAMSRLLPANEGEVLLDGADISSIRRKDLARTISVLPQTPTAPEGLNVADLVSRGRHPHQSWIRQWSSTDEAEVHKALEMTGSMGLAERTLDSLSGGQRQRVWISMVLAQNTDILFLDEPTTYLDLATSVEILELVQRLRRELDRTVVMVLHDLNLTAAHVNHVLLLHGGRVAAFGTPGEVLTAPRLNKVYGCELQVLPLLQGMMVAPVASHYQDGAPRISTGAPAPRPGY